MEFDPKIHFAPKSGHGEIAVSIPDMKAEIARLKAEADRLHRDAMFWRNEADERGGAQRIAEARADQWQALAEELGAILAGTLRYNLHAVDRRLIIAALAKLQEMKETAESSIADSITRFEVVDDTGRAYTRHGVSVELSYQDAGRTLKVFVKPQEKT